jgi:hypothetical protein
VRQQEIRNSLVSVDLIFSALSAAIPLRTLRSKAFKAFDR